jgi:hypothetical protein
MAQGGAAPRYRISAKKFAAFVPILFASRELYVPQLHRHGHAIASAAGKMRRAALSGLPATHGCRGRKSSLANTGTGVVTRRHPRIDVSQIQTGAELAIFEESKLHRRYRLHGFGTTGNSNRRVRFGWTVSRSLLDVTTTS